jgi:hypothetical protein
MPARRRPGPTLAIAIRWTFHVARRRSGLHDKHSTRARAACAANSRVQQLPMAIVTPEPVVRQAQRIGPGSPQADSARHLGALSVDANFSTLDVDSF